MDSTTVARNGTAHVRMIVPDFVLIEPRLFNEARISQVDVIGGAFVLRCRVRFVHDGFWDRVLNRVVWFLSDPIG